MSELWITNIERGVDDTPRGLASNNGFEAEDAARTLELAQNSLNAQYWRTTDHVEKLATMLWWQNKHRTQKSEADFVRDFVADFKTLATDSAKEGALRDPTTGAVSND